MYLRLAVAADVVGGAAACGLDQLAEGDAVERAWLLQGCLAVGGPDLGVGPALKGAALPVLYLAAFLDANGGLPFFLVRF